MPSDFNTVVFPDGTQPPTNPHQVLQPPPLFGALFTTLSRYLYHKRWIWNATYLNNPKLGVMAIAQILNTLIKYVPISSIILNLVLTINNSRMRIKEGFSFAHSAAGIINMVLEVEMSAGSVNGTRGGGTLPCVIQYVLFPPHCTNRSESRELGSGSEDETEIEMESEIELQMITEVWIEPQYGFVKNSPPARKYMEDEPYYILADKVRVFFVIIINDPSGKLPLPHKLKSVPFWSGGLLGCVGGPLPCGLLAIRFKNWRITKMNSYLIYCIPFTF